MLFLLELIHCHKDCNRADRPVSLLNRNLMAPEEFKNLGLVFEEDKQKQNGEATAATTNSK